MRSKKRIDCWRIVFSMRKALIKVWTSLKLDTEDIVDKSSEETLDNKDNILHENTAEIFVLDDEGRILDSKECLRR